MSRHIADKRGTGEDKLKNSDNIAKAKFIKKCKAQYTTTYESYPQYTNSNHDTQKHILCDHQRL